MKRLLPTVIATCLTAAAAFAASPAPSATPTPPTPAFKSGVDLEEAPGEPRTPASVEAQALSKKATAEFEKGDLDSAKRDYEKALKISPGNPACTINLGLVFHRQKRYFDAEELLKGLVHREPEMGLAWLVLGTVYYDQNKLDGALAALAQAAFLDPKDARVHQFFGITLGKKGWYSGAEDEMRKAIELQPTFAEAHFNLAVFYLQRTPPAVELARRHYQKARDLGAPRDAQVEKRLDE
jgi:Flp pilus assembly protein TadD